MAPPKPDVEAHRRQSVASVLELMGRTALPRNEANTLDACSVVKGMFNRVLREDQWDWFTVRSQLGFPNRMLAKLSATAIQGLRDAIKRADEPAFIDARDRLLELRVDICLDVYLGHRQLQLPADSGWVYVMSSRELPGLLKVGMTTRSVFERAREINSSTGVAIPFGVRKCWCVADAARAEKIAHHTLAGYRMRGDREFFRIEFERAAKMVQDALSDLEIRTLLTVTDAHRGLAASF